MDVSQPSRPVRVASHSGAGAAYGRHVFGAQAPRGAQGFWTEKVTRPTRNAAQLRRSAYVEMRLEER